MKPSISCIMLLFGLTVPIKFHDREGKYVRTPGLHRAKSININFGRLGWFQKRPAVMMFLNSKVRYETTGAYENYWRFMYKRADLTVEWTNYKPGSRPKWNQTPTSHNTL